MQAFQWRLALLEFGEILSRREILCVGDLDAKPEHAHYASEYDDRKRH